MADVARDILPLIIVRCASLLELSRALFIRSDACRLAPPLAGLLFARSPCAVQPTASRAVDWAGLLVPLRKMSNRDGMAQM